MDNVPYESIVEESNDGIFIAQNGEIVYANERLQELTGYAEATLVGAPKIMLVTDDDAALDEQYHSARTSSEEAPNQYEATLETKSGDRIPIEVTVNQISYDGEPAVVTFCRDIAEQKKGKAASEDLRREYESVFDHVQDALFLLDVDDGTVRYQRFNEREEAFTGKSTEDVRGKTPTEAFGDELGSELAANYRECIERRETLVYEEELNLTDETTIWQTKLTPVVVDGTVERIVGAGRDITELRNRERELEQAKTRLQALFDKAPDSITIHDVDGNILDVNGQAVDELGYTRDRLLEMNVTDFAVELDPATAQNIWAEMDSEETHKVEGQHQRKDGSTFPVEVWVSRTDVLGEPQYLALGRDITERKRREQKLDQFREAVEQTGHAVYITDIDGTIEYVNPAFEDITGYGEDEVIGETPQLFKSGQHGETFYADLWETVCDGNRWESEMVDKRADGEEIVIYQTISPITNSDGEPQKLVAVARDITERKEYEEALEAAREKLRQIIDLVPDLIFVKNREGEYLLANETTAELYGVSPGDVEGCHESEVIPSVDDSKRFRQDDLEVIESGDPKVVPEEELTTANGETRVLQTTKIPYQVPESGEDAVLGYARDVTDLTEYQHKLETQRDNLEILNQVVRHDIRNDLQLVLAYAETLSSYVDAEGEEYIEQVLDATRDAINITTTARDVTRVMLQSDVELKPVRLRPALESEVDNVRSKCEEALIRIDGTIPDIEVLCDGMLESVFRNLLKNAVQHNDKEVPEVSVSAAQQEDIVAVRIADNGPGISDKRKEKIFQQGEMGLDSEGTGLGLYLVETLVDRYGGNVYIKDNDPTGAIFIVELAKST